MQGRTRQFVDFRENHRKWQAFLATPVHELEVNFLGLQTRIEQYKNIVEVFSFSEVVGNEALKSAALGAAHFCVAVAR